MDPRGGLQVIPAKVDLGHAVEERSRGKGLRREGARLGRVEDHKQNLVSTDRVHGLGGYTVLEVKALVQAEGRIDGIFIHSEVFLPGVCVVHADRSPEPGRPSEELEPRGGWAGLVQRLQLTLSHRIVRWRLREHLEGLEIQVEATGV